MREREREREKKETRGEIAFRGSTEIKAGSHFKGGSRISSLVTEIGYFDSDITFRSRRSRFVVTFAKEQIFTIFFFFLLLASLLIQSCLSLVK